MADDITLKILQRIADGPVPLHTGDAAEIAPLTRYRELEASGLIEGSVIRGATGQIAKVRISGITHAGRAELESLLAMRKEKSPVTKSLKLMERIFWLIVGVGMTLFGLWVAKQLGLK